MNGCVSNHYQTMETYVRELINRLRGVYNIAVNDGAGPLNGGYVATRVFPTVRINVECAEVIEQMTIALESYAYHGNYDNGARAIETLKLLEARATKVADDWYNEQLRKKQ